MTHRNDGTSLFITMIFGIGIDIIHLPRIRTLLTRRPTSLLYFPKRILSNGELKEFNNIFLKNNLATRDNNLERDKIVIDNNVVKFLAVR